MSEDREEIAALESEGDDEVKMEAEAEEQPTPEKEQPRPKFAIVGEILEGKRAKKTVERLDFQVVIPKEEVKVEDGGGDKLGDIPQTNHIITRMKANELKPLHTILFDRPGKAATLKRKMRQFNGFTFEEDSEAYTRKRDKMLNKTSFNKAKLKVICKVLDLKQDGSQLDLANRILSFLITPKNRGKPLKKQKAKKRRSGSESDAKKKTKKRSKRKPKSTSASPKKAKSTSKSKAIVMDLTSSDEEEEDDKIEATLDSDSEKKPMDKKDPIINDDSDDSEEDEVEDDDDDDDEEEDEAESPMSKTSAKRQRAPAKKTGPPKKKVKLSDPVDVSDESEAETGSEPEEKPKKKKAAAKTKKADSSSNRKKTKSTVTEDSSDDDEPLIKMIKKSDAPSDEQLVETVKKLLKEANLEEMTMKQICQRVYDTYPDHDLTSRKDYIKQTVKTSIT